MEAPPAVVVIHNHRSTGTELVVSLVAAVMEHHPHHQHRVDTIIIIPMVLAVMYHPLRYVQANVKNDALSSIFTVMMPFFASFCV